MKIKSKLRKLYLNARRRIYASGATPSHSIWHTMFWANAALHNRDHRDRVKDLKEQLREFIRDDKRNKEEDRSAD